MRAPSAVVIATMSILYEHAAAYNSLFIGHSFFRPIAEKMPALASAAGLNHSQAIVFSGGASGAPLALWNSDSNVRVPAPTRIGPDRGSVASDSRQNALQ